MDVPNFENFSTPKVNISENFTNFVVQFAIPGFEKENFGIEIEKEVLTVSSKFAPKRESADTNDNAKFTRKEFEFGEFERSFTLPNTVNVDEVTADYINGILSITIPKKEVEKDIKKMVEIS